MMVTAKQKEALSMLFNKEIEPCCAYCLHASPVNENEAVCKKHGIVHLTYRCKRYTYDPTRRIPPEPEEIPAGYFSEKDFSLDADKR